MRDIFWFSIRPLIAVAIFMSALPASAQSLVQADPFVDTVKRYEAAAASLETAKVTREDAKQWAIVSEAISAAYFSERYEAARTLFMQYRDADLSDRAQVSGLAAILRTDSNDEAKRDARALLQGIASAPVKKDPLAPALAQSALAADAMRRDDLPATVALYREAMELAQRDLEEANPAQVYFSTLYARHLQFADRVAGKAAVEQTERLALATLPDRHPLWIGVWYDMAALAQSAGRFDEAAGLYAKITDLAAQQWGESDGRLYPILQYRAVALSGLGRREEALAIARMAVGVEGAQPAQDRAMHRELIGGLLLGEGQIKEASASYLEGLSLLQGTDPDDLRWAFIQSRLARTLSMEGKDAEALRMAELGETGFAAKLPSSHPARITADVMLAKAYARSGKAARGLEMLEASVAANETKMLDAYAKSQDVRSIAAGNNTLFRDFAWVALKNDRLEEAWRGAQLATLGELALSSSQLSYPGDAEGFRAALELVRQSRSDEATARATLAEGQGSSDDLGSAIARREKAEQALEANYPGHAELLRPSPVSIAEAQSSLAEHEAIIIPMVIEDRNTTIVLSRTAVTWQETVSLHNSTTGLISKLRGSLEEDSLSNGTSNAFDAAAAHEIYRRFFSGDVAEAIRGKTKLIFPSGGPLAQIPPSVLVTKTPIQEEPRRYLIEDFAISIRPNLRLIDTQRRAPPRAFAGIGAPILSEGSGSARSLRGMDINLQELRQLPSLPGSMAELEAMRAAFPYPETLLLTAAQATEPKIRSASLGDFRVLAFATHGLVGGQIRDLPEPALVLTPPELNSSEDDGLLTASEIAALDLAADWVILSACNTAAGNGRGSATYGGLARAFQLAGARSLLLSHWPLRDDAAAFLAVETLKRAEAGEDRAASLRAAQLELIAGTSGMPAGPAPGVWAPFVLIEG